MSAGETMFYDCVMLAIFIGGLSGLFLAAGAIVWIFEHGTRAFQRWVILRPQAKSGRRPPSIVRF